MTEEINNMINKFCDSIEKRINQYNLESELQRLKQENERLKAVLQEIKAIVSSNCEIIDAQGRKDILKNIVKAEVWNE